MARGMAKAPVTDYYPQMSSRVTHEDRDQFLAALRRQDDFWSQCFGNDFYQLHYSDLFTKMWQGGNAPVPRSVAYQFMAHLSEQTAKKYLNQAVSAGLLEEIPNPSDGRSRLVRLTADASERMRRWVDYSIKAYRQFL